MRLIILSLVFVLMVSCQTATMVNKPSTLALPEYIAVTNVNLISLSETNKVYKNTVVVIKDDKIFSINGDIPENAMVIDGTGNWLIPGLIDMHVHGLSGGSFSQGYPTRADTIFFDTQDLMIPYIASGVTTVFELSARQGNFAQRNEIARGSVIGPRMAFAGVIDGKGERAALDESSGRQIVRNLKKQGYRFIKVYTWLNRETYVAIIDEANQLGIKIVGHIPVVFKDKVEDAFIPNFGLIAHAEELSKVTESYTYEQAQIFARLAKRNDTWLIPNLSNMEWIVKQSRSLQSIKELESLKYVHPLMQTKWLQANRYNNNATPELIEYFEQQRAFHKLIVKAFKEESVPMLAGTDAGISGVVWGFSLHDELAWLVEAGMTPLEALESATRLSAKWLGIDDKIGSIEVGKYADLVLLSANPLEDIRNTRLIAGSFINGRWVSKNKIDYMLNTLANKNAKNLDKDEFNWNKLSRQK